MPSKNFVFFLNWSNLKCLISSSIISGRQSNFPKLHSNGFPLSFILRHFSDFFFTVELNISKAFDRILLNALIFLISHFRRVYISLWPSFSFSFRSLCSNCLNLSVVVILSIPSYFIFFQHFINDLLYLTSSLFTPLLTTPLHPSFLY